MDTQILFFPITSKKSTENIFCGTDAIRDTKLPKSGERRGGARVPLRFT